MRNRPHFALRQCICQKFLAFWLSWSFDFPGISRVKNISKINRAFESPKLLQNLPIILPKIRLKPLFKKRPEFSKILVKKTRIFKTAETFEMDGMTVKPKKLFISAPEHSRTVLSVFLSVYFWTYFQNYFWNSKPVRVSKPETRKRPEFLSFYFRNSCWILRKSTGLRKSYWNARPYFAHFTLCFHHCKENLSFYLINPFNS